MVTEQARTGDRYHHGNLRAALLESALEVLTETGVAGFSMREAARRAGVSQSAPKHHFGDTRGLLGALATRAYRQLCERLEGVECSGLDARERVTGLAVEYVAFARDNRALFDLMWRMTQFDYDDPELAEQKHRALRALDRVLRGTDAGSTSDEDPGSVQSYAVWSLVHGYTSLALEGAIDEQAADPLASDLLPAMLRLVDLRPVDGR
ncbi:TetR/AcrR family transcriptional regulator [Actinospica sp. MGRD01-02]|uniref:TetR/AcrR family transcriptional regulator n=1 Tax=Actinospica acidithermotolerans TaxID=2828514 RepID=A0A941EIL5_9ACTN|nr:TetR/AcrR family transcriptional regulator [Actinospica acidithermotolerans]MBR7828319.1 TetR/AcrR family transcriptional regulator [Actinospica acidithermotolerans]